MSKIVKVSLIILAVLPVLCNCETIAADKQEADAQTKIENPYHGARVLVEALIVEVKPEAIEKAGVGPLSKERATAAKILDIIKDKNAGHIQSSQKLAMVSPGEARMNVSGRKEIPLSADTNGSVTSWAQYDIGSKIAADLIIEPEGRILRY
jgi:predicted ribonuclease toxin of YeeF-YezG toxin-antitoxin module